ncbi:hypothetical protein DXG01_005628 [Tephrocybe rancida]|nr:hypothetical protein DXG01_005628 [Tephrocybe rancida]
MLSSRNGQRGPLAQREDAAFTRLFGGCYGLNIAWVLYNPHTLVTCTADKAQNKVLKPIGSDVTDWVKACRDSLVHKGDLPYTHQILDAHAMAQSGHEFVGYLDDEPGGKTLKTEYLDAAFIHSGTDLFSRGATPGNKSTEYKNINKKLDRLGKTWRTAHSKFVTARRDPLRLYTNKPPAVPEGFETDWEGHRF